jgi:hypothetical protein
MPIACARCVQGRISRPCTVLLSGRASPARHGAVVERPRSPRLTALPPHHGAVVETPSHRPRPQPSINPTQSNSHFSRPARLHRWEAPRGRILVRRVQRLDHGHNARGDEQGEEPQGLFPRPVPHLRVSQSPVMTLPLPPSPSTPSAAPHFPAAPFPASFTQRALHVLPQRQPRAVWRPAARGCRPRSHPGPLGHRGLRLLLRPLRPLLSAAVEGVGPQRRRRRRLGLLLLLLLDRGGGPVVAADLLVGPGRHRGRQRWGRRAGRRLPRPAAHGPAPAAPLLERPPRAPELVLLLHLLLHVLLVRHAL